MAKWMLYGAYGYTGELIAEEAVKRGHKPLLAGRNAAKLQPLAARLGLDYAAIDLNDTAALEAAVRGVDLVVHAAGPFIHTSQPMIDACIKGITNYLDITGEVAVFENIFTHDQKAYDRGIALIPGVGFDVVPSDCLIAYVAAKLPDATDLTLGINALSSASAGTTKTALEGIGGPTMIRKDGKLVQESLPPQTFSFISGDLTVTAINWGDLSTGYRTSGIPNIKTYMHLSPAVQQQMGLINLMIPLLRLGFVKQIMGRFIDRTVSGPDAHTRANARSYVYAKVSNAAGEAVEAWLDTVEGYRLTAETTVMAVDRVLAERPRGALSPAQAFGADFVLEVPTTVRMDALPGA